MTEPFQSIRPQQSTFFVESFLKATGMGQSKMVSSMYAFPAFSDLLAHLLESLMR
jgi:hypothetical protein